MNAAVKGPCSRGADCPANALGTDQRTARHAFPIGQMQRATFLAVPVTDRQGFFTADAVKAVAETTTANISVFETTGRARHEVSADVP